MHIGPTNERRRRWVRYALFVALGVYAASVMMPLSVVPIEVGRETTYFDGPVRDDGTVDYFAAFNAEHSKGVTPENNAMVPLVAAYGKRGEPGEADLWISEQLGVTPPDEQGFVPLAEYVRSLEETGEDEEAHDPERAEYWDEVLRNVGTRSVHGTRVRLSAERTRVRAVQRRSGRPRRFQHTPVTRARG